MKSSLFKLIAARGINDAIAANRRKKIQAHAMQRHFGGIEFGEKAGTALNAATPYGTIYRRDLTTYAFAILQDSQKVLNYLRRLAPVVPTGLISGDFNVFPKEQSFKAYSALVARRAIGGKSNTIQFLDDRSKFSCDPYGLRIAIDSFELARVGGVGSGDGTANLTMLASASPNATDPVGSYGMGDMDPDKRRAVQLLEQGKARTLTINCLLTQLVNVVSGVKAAVAPIKGAGNWGKADVNPIAEINKAIMAAYIKTGMVLNKMDLDLGAWAVMIQNPQVQKAMGTVSTAVTIDKIKPLLINPAIDIQVVDVGALATGGIGDVTSTVKGVLQGTCLLYFQMDQPDQYNPTAFVTFSPGPNLFTDVFTYPEIPNQLWYENNWTANFQVVSSLLAARIDVAGAYDVSM